MAIGRHFENLKRQWPVIALGAVVLIIFLAHPAGYRLSMIEQMENHAFDLRMQLGTLDKPDRRFVIVDIDEKSLKAEGQWPWSRDKLEHLLNNLFEHYQVQQVGFDIVFAEPDRSSGLDILEQLAMGDLRSNQAFRDRLTKLRSSLDYDRRLASSISGRPVVLGYYFNTGSDREQQTSGALPPPIIRHETLGNNIIHAPQADGYGANLELYQKAAEASGHFNPEIDSDGVIRRVPLLYEFEGDYYEALALAMVRSLINVDEIVPLFSTTIEDETARLEGLQVGRYRIPVDEHSHAIVPYRGKRGSFPYVSATDVISRDTETQVLENTIVMIGTSAPGLFDLRATPVQNKFPGVEIHVNLVAGMLDQRILRNPEYTRAIEFLLLLLVGLLFVLIVPVLTPFMSMMVTLFLLVTITIANVSVWYVADHVIPLASVLLMILVLFLINMSYGFFIERFRKSKINELFGQYVPPELVDEMNRNPESFTKEADERELTVLFSDVRGFTTLSEGMSPAELSEMMNEFLTELTTIIHQHRGTIDKYMGDAIMAFWGAPLSDSQHARHAVQAGIAMNERMNRLQEKFATKDWPELRIGVGINTGMMSVGNMGSEFRMAYTVIGDSVNLASRLEGLTKQYGVDMLVSEATRNEVTDYVFREIDRVRVKGKSRPVGIYEPIAHQDEISEKTLKELDVHQSALLEYRARNWDEALRLFRLLNEDFKPRKIYSIYLERTEYFINNPPGELWNGVFTFDVK